MQSKDVTIDHYTFSSLFRSLADFQETKHIEMEESDKFDDVKLAMGLSLDEYMRKRDMGDQFSLMNLRKKRQNINKEDLDQSLDSYIEANKQIKAESSTTTCGRFDRRSLQENSDDESDDEPASFKRINDFDVEMKDQTPKEPVKFATIKEEEDEEDIQDLDDMLHFRTVESKNGLRVRSQQWRIQPDNLVDRPKGVKRLEFLPLSGEERFKRTRFTGNKVERNYRSRASSSLNLASMGSDILTEGTFVEKGRFTYKFADRNRDGSGDGIVGIEHARHVYPSPAMIPPSQQAAANPININMNWEGFFQGMNQCVDKFRPPPPPPVNNDSNGLASAAFELIRRLTQSTSQSPSQFNLEVQQDMANIQNRPIIVGDRKGSTSSAGDNFNSNPQSNRQPVRYA